MEHVNVLIMDDSREKINAILELLEECSINKNNIKVAQNIHEGRILLRDNLFDLLIIDMVIYQKKDSPVPDEEGGIKFIEDIHMSSALIKPIYIIGLTQYEDKLEALRHRLEDKLWFLIHYKIGDESWRARIKSKVYNIISTKRDIECSIMEKNKFNLGIICALQEEFDAMKAAFDQNKWGRINIPEFPFDIHTTTITTAYGNSYSICAICACNAGVVPTSSLAVMVYCILKVDAIFMTGFAAGVHHAGRNLGDIIVAKTVQDYASGKLIEVENEDLTKTYKLIKEISQKPAAPDLISKACEAASSKDCLDDINDFIYKKTADISRVNVEVTPTVCGPFVVAAKGIMDEIIKDDRKLAALDMEGFGLYYAAYLLGKKALWMKGICDFGDTNKGDEYHKKCAFASGRFLFYMIREYM